MSGISATDFFTDGAELFDQDKYKSTVSTSFEPDPIQMEKDFTRPLNQRIITLHSSDREVFADYRVDDVQVHCVSDAYRAHQQNQWNNVKTEAESKSRAWTVTAIGSGLVTAASGVLLISGATIVSGVAGPAVAVVAGLVCLVSLFVIANANGSALQAVVQISKWSEPPAYKIGKERDEAHQKGFPYIYHKNLKLVEASSATGRFHPKQVEHEYKKHFDTFCRKMLGQTFNTSQSDWVGTFRQSNPLSRDWMLYGLGDIPDHMKPVVDDHARFEAFLKDIDKSYETLKSELRATAKEKIDAYNLNRDAQLQPLADIRDRDIAAAKVVRDKVSEKHPFPSKHFQDAQEAYAKTKKTLEENYALKADPIKKKFDDKISEANEQLAKGIAKLDAQKGQQFANNYHAAHELLVRAKQAWDNKGYQPVNFQQYFPYQAPQPAYGYQVQQQPAQPVYHQQPAQPAYPEGNPGYGMQPSYGYPVQQQGYAIVPGAGG